MMTIPKRLFVVFVLGLTVGIPVGARLQTKVDVTVWPPARVDSLSAAPRDGQISFSTTGGGSGQVKADTSSFHLTGQFTVTWSTTVADRSAPGGDINILLRGQSADMVGSGLWALASPPSGITVERHIDCAQGCYFTVTTNNLRYALQVRH